jgi:hypothetical protein
MESKTNLPPIFILPADTLLQALADPQDNILGMRIAARGILALLEQMGAEVLLLQDTWSHTSTKLGRQISAALQDDVSFTTQSIYKHSSASLEDTPIRCLELLTSIELAERDNRHYIIVTVLRNLFESLDEYPEAIGNNVTIWDLADLRNQFGRDGGHDDGSNTSGNAPPPPRPSDNNDNNSPALNDDDVADNEETASQPASAYAYGIDSHTNNPLAKFFTNLGIFLAPLLFQRLSGQDLSSSRQEATVPGSETVTPTPSAILPQTTHQSYLAQSTSQTAPSDTQQSVPLVDSNPLVDQSTTNAAALEIVVNPLSENLFPPVVSVTPQLDMNPALGARLLDSLTPAFGAVEGLPLPPDKSVAQNGTYAAMSSASVQQQFLLNTAPNSLSSNPPQLRIAIDLPNELGYSGLENNYYANRWAISIDPPLPTGDRPAEIPFTLYGDSLPLSTPTTINNPTPSVQPDSRFTSGVFTVGESGAISVDFLYDGGGNVGELGIFSLNGLGQYSLQSADFIQEAVRRVTSNSLLGHVVISDVTQGARLSQALPWETNVNQGAYLGPLAFAMQPGDQFGFALLSNSTFQQIQSTPGGSGYRDLLFSVTTTEPDPLFSSNQIANTGIPQVYALEDLSRNRSDNDFNDLIFQLNGAIGSTMALDSVIARQYDWRSTALGQELVQVTQPTPNPQPGRPLTSSSLSSQDSLVMPYVEANKQAATTQPTTTNSQSHSYNPWRLDSYSWSNQSTISYPSGDRTNSSLVLNTPKLSAVNSASGGSHTTPGNIIPAPCECNSSTLFSGNFEDPFSDTHTKTNVISNSDDPFRSDPERNS